MFFYLLLFVYVCVCFIGVGVFVLVWGVYYFDLRRFGLLVICGVGYMRPQAPGTVYLVFCDFSI